MLLTSCATTKPKTEIVTVHDKLQISDEHFDCTPQGGKETVVLPPNEVLQAWNSHDIFVWGSKNYFWGDMCSIKMNNIKKIIDCYNDKTKCEVSNDK